MPKFQNFLTLHLLPGLETNGEIIGVSLGVCQEFERRAPRSFKAWPVDNLWISMEFGEFNERTYRYDYHASLFLARKSYARIVVKTTLLVSFSKPFLKTRNRESRRRKNSISNYLITRIFIEINDDLKNVVDNSP